MHRKLSKVTLQFCLGISLVLAIATGCNDTSSSKETQKDTAVTTDTTKMDTTKMDKAKTRPIVNPPDQPGK